MQRYLDTQRQQIVLHDNTDLTDFFSIRQFVLFQRQTKTVQKQDQTNLQMRYPCCSPVVT